MTDVIVDSQGNAMLTKSEDGITQFWNEYEEKGIKAALDLVRSRSEEGNLLELEQSVPFLVEEARNRNIDITKFLSELDRVLKEEEEENASGTDDGVSELHTDSSDEVDQAEDGDEPGSAQDADGEARAE